MLEYNFGELDDDFITFWARYLTAKGVDFHEELKYFARKGQINAVQNWYLYNPVGEDTKIDKIVEGYKGENFNELYAMANYLFMREDLYKKFCDLSEEYTDLIDLLMYDKNDELDEDDDEYDEFEDEFDEEELDDIDKEEVEKDLRIVRDKIYNMPHVKIIQEAYKKALEYAKANKNYIAYSTSNEILDCYTQQMLPVCENTEEARRKILKNYEIIINLLKNEYKKNMDKDPNFKPTTNPALAFTIATNILIYQKEGEHAGFAYYLLDELAERDYLTKPNIELRIN